MKKFIVLYYSTPEAMAAWASLSPEQIQEGMKPWNEWEKRMGSHLVDMGSPLMGATKIGANGNHSQSKNHVGGYSIIQATDMAQALSLLGDHPHHSPERGTSVEVLETMSM